MKRKIGTVAALVAGLAVSQAVLADDFYQGKTIKLIVGSAAGAGYDQNARQIARHMPRHIPGNPTIVVNNMPAAGGIAATNYVYNVGEKDGTVLGLVNRYNILAPITGVEQAQFKSEKFHWIGTPASYQDDAYLLVVRSALPYKTVDDVRKANPPLAIGATGSEMSAVLSEAFGLNLRIIESYQKNEVELALERGEVDAHTIGYANMKARRPQWVATNFVRPIVQAGHDERIKALPDVPTARELAKTADDRALIEMAEALLVLAYPFALAPEVPNDRVEIIRKAFQETMNDPAYREDLVKQKMEFGPKTGAEIQSMIDRLAQSSPAVIARYKKVVSETK
jgi:tripartite-type tricarboxylate transporter receptor subunit TctC